MAAQFGATLAASGAPLARACAPDLAQRVCAFLHRACATVPVSTLQGACTTSPPGSELCLCMHMSACACVCFCARAQGGESERRVVRVGPQADPLDMLAQDKGQAAVAEAMRAFELLASKDMARVGSLACGTARKCGVPVGGGGAWGVCVCACMRMCACIALCLAQIMEAQTVCHVCDRRCAPSTSPFSFC